MRDSLYHLCFFLQIMQSHSCYFPILAVFKMCFEVYFCFSVLMSFLGHLTFLRGAELRIPYLKVNLNSQTVHVANVSFSQMFQRLITLISANTHMKFWFWEFLWMVVNLWITSSLINLPDWLNIKGPEWSVTM